MTASRPADIGVVVVSYNSLATLPACLDSLFASEGVAAVAVVDNDSRDGGFAWLQARNAAEPRLRLAQLPNNPGFSAACNQGAAMLDTPWLAFVNPDVQLPPDALMTLRDLAAAQQTPTLVGGVLRDGEGRPDPAVRRRDLSVAALIAGLGRRDSLNLPTTGDVLQRVPVVSGALFLMPRALFERVAGFDTGYRLHVEDLDLCRRVRASGGQVAIANAVSARHLRGVSSRSRPLFVEWHKHRGLWRYWWRHEAKGLQRMMAPVVLLALVARFVLVAAPRAWRAWRAA